MTVTSYGRNKNLDELKNSRTSHEIQSKESRRQKLILFNIPISHICSKTISVSEIGPGFDLQDPKKIIGLEDRLNQKMTDIFLIKLINLINSRFY